MTREEAIQVLKRTIAYDSDFAEAKQMAISALSAEHKHCWDCKHYEPKYNVCHAPEVVKQVTSKLNNPCDSLLKDDSAECKEQKSKLEHDREWIIGCIKHDGFIKTDRFDKANQIIHDALSAEAEWIPCSERLPIPPAFCLVTTDGSHNDVIDIALYMSDGWHKASEVIAWMPLPKPYRKDGE